MMAVPGLFPILLKASAGVFGVFVSDIVLSLQEDPVVVVEGAIIVKVEEDPINVILDPTISIEVE